MATNKVQDGGVLTWTNGSGSDVSAGDPVLIGVRLGVALVDIADGKSGSVAVEGVYSIAKNASLVISQGDALYWDAGDDNLNKTPTDNTLAGYAFDAAAETATTVNIKLNG